MKLHGYLFKNGDVLQDYAVKELERVSSYWVLLPFKNKELVNLLLIHNQVFATDNCQVLFILAFLNGDNLVRLSCLRF